MNKRKVLSVTLIMSAVMLSIIIYAGHFFIPQEPAGESGNTAVPAASTAGGAEIFPVEHFHFSEQINGKKQEINILEVDAGRPGVKVMPVLSSDLVYGFENLSSIVKRKRAYAAVNGGFFTQYGLPSGMVAAEGKVITASTGKYPVLTIEKGKAALSVIDSRLWLEHDGGKLEINGINRPGQKGEAIAYTPYYGLTNRAKTDNLTVTVGNGIVTGAGVFLGETHIPENGMLLTFYLPGKYSQNDLPIKAGDAVSFKHEPAFSEDGMAYECGPWIVKDGKVVIGDRNEWIGVLTNNDPRTAVGIKKDGKVVLMAVDGRQPGYSTGMTGRELGDFLLKYGVENAAMLDGGASTEMIVNGSIVNKPSFKGEERPLGGGIVIIAE